MSSDQTGRDDRGGKNGPPNIADAEEQLRQLVDTALDAVVTCDTASRIVVWNSGAQRMFGWTAQEAVGKRLTDTIIPPELRDAHERGMAHYLASGEDGMRHHPTLRSRLHAG